MQTFLPYADFELSAKSLDRQRLGKQRVEGMQIINAIENPIKQGWQNHPCVTMWRPYPTALKQYTNIMMAEWIKQGYRNTMMFYAEPFQEDFELPFWLGDDRIHSSHRSNLLRKDYDYYRQHKWNDNPQSGYIWHDLDNLFYEQVSGTKERIYL
mgnify:CR=1 FL=1|tara:strand:+ start:6927 stop:7388 length:462 start_codon:yes stop_codon:yes gene_type:complete